VKDELTTTKSQLDRTKSEVEENAAAWRQREESFLACVKESTEANNNLKQENTKLFESQKVIREENAKLRENIKKSFEEINAIKEELETVRGENSQLNKFLTEKQNALQTIKLDYESLKVSEAAAQRSLRELNHMLLVETTPKSTSPYFSPYRGCKSPLDAKETDNKSQKEASVGSSSNLSEMKAASVAITEDTDQLEKDFLISVDGSERKKKKKKKGLFGKMNCFFKGKSFRPIPPLPPPSYQI
jgi:DNA repair exonuclease SbcCD ATPase subunit